MQFNPSENVSSSSDTEQLLEKIKYKAKMKAAKRSKAQLDKLQNVAEGKVKKSSTNASKEDLSINIGLAVFTNGKFKQVRHQNGGGISHCRLPKPVSKSDIIKEAVSAFYPDGEGGPGKATDFSFDIASDVAGKRLFFDNETASEFMKRLRMKNMRCYLLAKLDVESSSDELPDIGFTPAPTSKYMTKDMPSTSKDGPVDAHHPSTSAMELDESLYAVETDAHSSMPGSIDLMDEALLASNALETVQEDTFPVSPTEDAMPFAEMAAGEVQTTAHVEPTTNGSGAVMQPPMENEPSIADAAAEIPQEILEELVVGDASSSGEVIFNPAMCVVDIEVHRGMACNDLITFFMKNAYSSSLKYEVKMLQEDGTPELAEDNGGVIRDALTEFWDTFYLQYTVGNSFKIPCVRHDMSESHWKAVAMVILMGYKQEGIFPIKLAPPFMKYALFGEITDPVDPFLKYVAEMDRGVIEAALQDWESVDQDDLLDVLDRYETKTMAKKENIDLIVRELSKQELVQKPSFVGQQWQNVLNQLHMDAHTLSRIYSDLQPTAKKVLKVLTFPENMNADENTLSNHLKRLIREFDPEVLALFLRFCTGSDMMVKKSITVSFVKSDSSCMVRSPTSHTCGAILELPVSYGKDPYLSLRSEFCTLLRNRYWRMDIV